MVLNPGSTIGVLGGGQLGRMLAIAARRMGYRIHVLDPVEDCPTAHVADLQVTAHYDDIDAVKQFAQHVDVITFEFENVPAESLNAIAAIHPILPSPEVLHTCRHRVREKQFLDSNGIPVAPFHVCQSADDVAAGLEKLGAPAILKSAEFGYDGKGQIRIDTPDAEAATHAWQTIDAPLCVLEKFVRFSREISVVCARTTTGEFAAYPPGQNDHANHILDITTVPAQLPDHVTQQAIELAHHIADAIGLVGVLAVEMFLLDDNQLIINELAPRPHNSGHYTFDACVTCQFEQQLRAICGLPLGDPSLLRPAAAMANLLGDLWPPTHSHSPSTTHNATDPNWPAMLAHHDVKLHLYGKQSAKPGRKMGHLTTMADTPESAQQKVIAARDALKNI